MKSMLRSKRWNEFKNLKKKFLISIKYYYIYITQFRDTFIYQFKCVQTENDNRKIVEVNCISVIFGNEITQ